MEPGEPAHGTVLVPGLHGGVDDGAAAVAVPRVPDGEQVEQGQHPVPSGLRRRELFGEPEVDAVAAVLQGRFDQAVLGAEVAVDRQFRCPGVLGDLVDADVVHAPLVEQLDGARQHTGAGGARVEGGSCLHWHTDILRKGRARR